jgi:hypothetical protein
VPARHAHDPRLLGERLQYGLPNPPHGVGDELDPLRLVELVRRADEPEVPLVDEIRERDSLVLIFLGDGDHEAQIRAHELVERFRILHTDELREAHFLIAIDQRVRADVPKILIQRPFVVRRLLMRGYGHTGRLLLRRPARMRAGARANPASNQ